MQTLTDIATTIGALAGLATAAINLAITAINLATTQPRPQRNRRRQHR